MRTIQVTTQHEVYIDDYKQGELNRVNSYNIESVYKCLTIEDAINNHFANHLYLPFEYKNAEKSEDKKAMYWSALVDENNETPNIYDIDKWKEGKKELYVNNIYITVSEIVNLTF
jgi:hypothetical protein